MSFDASSGHIIVTDQNGNTAFNTAERMMYIHTTRHITFSIPSRGGGNFNQNILIDTLPRSADFIFGRGSGGGLYDGFELNGTILLDAVYGVGFYSDWVIAIRFLSIFVSGASVYANIRGGNQSNEPKVTLPSRSFSLVLYAGNYDL